MKQFITVVLISFLVACGGKDEKPVAVSYTHLDVYKRQMQGNTFILQQLIVAQHIYIFVRELRI